MQDFVANIGQFGYNKLLTLVVKEDVKTWRCVLLCREVFPHNKPLGLQMHTKKKQIMLRCRLYFMLVLLPLQI